MRSGRAAAFLQRWRQWLTERASGDSLMLGLGAGVGLATGLLAAALIATIAFVQGLAWGDQAGAAEVLLVPAAGGLAVGLLLRYWVPECSGGGTVRVMSAVAMQGGRLPARVPAGGVLASGLALGTGASGGREGPIVLIGGGVGSLAGRLFAVDEERMRTLIAAGAAAGIGASFNAPIGGMLFAIELIIGSFRARLLQVVVVASVVGSVTARQLIGAEIIYQPASPYTFSDPRELALYALLGLVAVGVGLAFIHGEDLAKRLFARVRLWPPLVPALGGLGVGAIALAVPEVLGTGDKLPPIDGVRSPIQWMLDGGFGTGWAPAGLLLVLLGAKLAATSLSIGSGSAVGRFAPLVFCGAALGGALGVVAEATVPAGDVQPGAFALVGVAAVFAAAARAPLTAILIAFELTGSYELVLPLMLSVGVATFVADRVQPESVYTFFLRKQGIVYGEPEDVDIMQVVRVGEVMTADPVTVPTDLPLEDLRPLFRRTRSHGFPVVRNGRLAGVVSVGDLARATADDSTAPPRTVGDICTRRVLTVTPRDPVSRALRRMAARDVGRLPVVADDDHGRLVGVIRRGDIVTAYRRALTRSLGAQQRRQSSRLRGLTGTRFVELVVDGRAASADCAVRDVSWPSQTVVVGLRRDGEALEPTGDTVLRAGDEVVVLTSVDAAEEVRGLLGVPAEPPGAEPASRD